MSWAFLWVCLLAVSVFILAYISFISTEKRCDEVLKFFLSMDIKSRKFEEVYEMYSAAKGTTNYSVLRGDVNSLVRRGFLNKGSCTSNGETVNIFSVVDSKRL